MASRRRHGSRQASCPRQAGTATLIGARGIFTIGLRGTLGIVDNRQGVAGAWSVCGGTGAYTRLRGRGHWNAVADLRAAPAGMMPPTARPLLGRTHRGSRRTRVGFAGAPCPVLRRRRAVGQRST
jgi:hypothetical protein